MTLINGAACIVVTGVASVFNTGTVAGGQGGMNIGGGSLGGAGGNAVSLLQGGTIENGGVVVGGAGGSGSISSGFVGSGGVGGGGAYVLGDLRLVNNGRIVGGLGGAGGTTTGAHSGGGGGAGGAGMLVSAAATVLNRGQIIGGAGGAGGYGTRGSGSGGGGGGGVSLEGNARLINFGTISGGASVDASNIAGNGVFLGYGGTVLNGRGALISGQTGVDINALYAATVVNSGTIVGVYYSVRFSGGTSANTLVAHAGPQFVGEVNGGGVFIGGNDSGGGILELAGGTGKRSRG